MTTEQSINALTAQTSELLAVCVALKNGAAQQIADAVFVSTNAAIVPLISMAANLITTQALLVSTTTEG